MNHRKQSKKHFGRKTKHREAMFANLAASLIEHGQIKTTLPKAKALRPFIEKLITIASADDKPLQHRVRVCFAKLKNHKEASSRLINVVAPFFQKRPGGYTRILKCGFRPGDQAPMAFIQFVDWEKQLEAEAA